MKHKMRLHNNPFELIQNGTKTIELRLNDEKRKLINIGDIIEFENRITKELIITEVTNLYKYNSFEELYPHFDKISMGYKETEVADPYDMEQYYSKEEQVKYGVVGIEIKLLNANKLEIINNDKLSIEDINNIVRRAKVLLVNNDELTICCSNHNYFLLGGHTDEDESDMECLHREILEEAGVNIDFNELFPFMTIKYLNKDYPSIGQNTLNIANYYLLNYKLLPNYEKMNLTEEEKQHKFQIVTINKNDILEFLEDSLAAATRPNVTLDTIKVIKEYINKFN